MAKKAKKQKLKTHRGAAKRFKKTKSGVCLVHQVLLRLSENWRRLKSAQLCATVVLPEPASPCITTSEGRRGRGGRGDQVHGERMFPRHHLLHRHRCLAFPH